MENIKSETTGQKRIDTVAVDIKSLIAGISNGKPAKVTEENMNKFLDNIKEAFNSWNNPVREKDGKLRMSVLGKPTRQLWYDRYSPKKTKDYDASLNLKFLYGHILEHLILYLAELTGHKVEHRQKKVEIDNIKGHLDAVVDGEVCDVKSASAFGFKKFKNGELVGDDPFGYLAQLSGYETGMGTSKGGFLVIDKSTGDICLYKPDELAKPNVPTLIKRLKETLESRTPPEKCYELSETKGGNKSLPIGCQYCSHKWECHSDTNGGKGLRVFKYANKNVYLAEVNKQPNVEEITHKFKEELTTYGKRIKA
tara:strand:- start:50 stop:979 length:930 start_codon:yes stop_codon:yes gene_type:complete